MRRAGRAGHAATAPLPVCSLDCAAARLDWTPIGASRRPRRGAFTLREPLQRAVHRTAGHVLR